MHPLHRVWVEVRNLNAWYAVIREANALYGNHKWRGQPRVRRKLQSRFNHEPVKVWFDVPDANFATWISVKHGLITRLAPNK